MNKNYKIVCTFLLTVLITIFSFYSTCFATDQDVSIETQDSNVSESGNVEYIGSYEDYENLYNEMSTGYDQNTLKEYYEDYQNYLEEYYNSYTRKITFKAKVIRAESVEEQYEYNDAYYSVSKFEFQPITIEILEGEYKGQKFEMDYLLTGDSLNNIKYSTLKTGDVLFVAVDTDPETGELYADITNTGSNVQRTGIIFCIGLVAAAMLMIYGGKKGVIAALISLLILDFCMVIIPNMAFVGQGFIIGGIILIVLLTALISLMKLGITVNSIKAIIISLILTVATFLLTIVANYLTRTVGTIFEVAAIAENVLLGNMNFEHLYIIMTMIIASAFITNLVCSSISKIEENKAKKFDEKVNVTKELLGSHVLMVVVALFATYIPNHLLLLTNKYTMTEIWNSEILISELVRLFVIIIVMSLTIPTVAFFSEESEQNNK